MSNGLKVKKRNGVSEKFNIEKINKVITWAIDGYSGVSLTDIEINAKINITDGITLLQKTLVTVSATSTLNDTILLLAV